MRLYTKETASELAWPQTPDSDYLQAVMQHGASQYVANIQTQLMALESNNIILPITLNNAEYDNSYVCSPFGQYINYGLEELDNISGRSTRPFLKGALHCMGGLLKAGLINKTIHVNNWLLSTNLYPELSYEQIQSITEMLTTLYPDHALLFRSVNALDKDLLKTLMKLNYSPIFSRQVFLLDPEDQATFKERHFKKDLQLLQDSRYEVVESHQFSLDDVPRIAKLYQALNIDKHTAVNPHFTEKFVQLAIEKGILKLRGLKKNGSLDAVYGCVQKGKMMVAPFFGYDTSQPEELGLYRQLSALAVLEAKEKGFILNQSGGAASFKKRRKATPVTEYHAVYVKHLPKWRQAPWQTLKQIGDKFIIPLVLKKGI